LYSKLNIMKKIKLEMASYTEEFTPAQLKNELANLYFMLDAFIAVLNPKVVDESHSFMTKEEYVEIAKRLYLVEYTRYNKEFIEKVFSTIPK
jgi:hypothetical protein